MSGTNVGSISEIKWGEQVWGLRDCYQCFFGLFILGQRLAVLDSTRGFYFISFSNHRHCLTPLKPITLQILPHGPDFCQSPYMLFFCWALGSFHCFKDKGFGNVGHVIHYSRLGCHPRRGKKLYKQLTMEYARKASCGHAEARQNKNVHAVSILLHIYILHEEWRRIMVEKVIAGSSLSFQKLNLWWLI